MTAFRAGEIQSKSKNRSCLYLNSHLTLLDHSQRSISLVFCPIFKWNLSKNCDLHLSTSTRTKNIEKSVQNMPSKFKAALIFLLKMGKTRIVPTACFWGHFCHVLTEGTRLPQAKLLSNWGRRVAQQGLLLSREASPPFKDRANIPPKMLEGQGNAEKKTRERTQAAAQPASLLQEENPTTAVGHSVCLQEE